MQRINIADKINLCYVQKTKFKTNYFKVSFCVDIDKKYTTKLSLLSAVLLRACEKYPTIASMSDRLDYLYDMDISGSVSRRGEKLFFDYDCDFIRPQFVPDSEENLLDEALEMFCQVIFKPLVKNGCFDKKILDSEKTELENTIKSQINYKRSYVKEQCIKTLCEGEKFAISPYGELEDIPLVTGENLYEFYKEFLSMANIEIVFVGEADVNKLSQGFSEIFSSIQNRNPAELEKTFVTGDTKPQVVEKCEQMKISQGNLALGFRTGVCHDNDDAAAMTVFRDIYGGSATSRLFMNVREKLSLCYYCGANTDLYKGILLVLSGIQSENKEKAQAAILCELEEIQDKGVTESELATAKLNIVNGYKSMDDNPAGLAFWYVNRHFEGMSPDLQKELDSIMKVSIDDVANVAKKVKLDTVYFLKGETQEEAEA